MYTNNITLDVNNILKNPNENYIIKKYTFNNNEYIIIKYNKEKLKFYEESNDISSFNNLSKFRSVVLRNNKVICYSPGKSISYKNFTEKYSNTEKCWLEDFIDGTMINVFYDNINDTWEIATKSTVGGNTIFFNDLQSYNYFNNDNNNGNKYAIPTFRSMFFESCNLNNFNLNTLNKNFSYTFVMQHPFNRIVTPTSIPLIFLIKVYQIDNSDFETEVCIKELNIETFINNPPYIFLNTSVKFINKYPLSNYKEIESYYLSDNIPYYCVGCMIYSDDGTRTKIRNSQYETVRKLRGNQPKLQYNYLCLKQENKIKEFLKYYPEHTAIFNTFKLLMYTYTNELFINYISCFIRKEKELKNYEFQYKTHMYKLHEKFKSELKPNNRNIDKKIVIDYVNSLHPAQQMFVINYKNANLLKQSKLDDANDANDVNDANDANDDLSEHMVTSI